MDSTVRQKLDIFFAAFPQKKYKKRELLIRAGERTTNIFYLTRGHVKQYLITNAGDEINLNIYKEGSFIPMSLVFNPRRSPYFYEAMGEVKTREAPLEKVTNFVNQDSEVMMDLLHRLFVGIDGLFLRFEQLMSGDAKHRLYVTLVICAKRFGVLRKGYLKLTLKLTHQELASLSGLSRETVSREMKKLKERNLLSYTKASICINDLTQLEQMSASPSSLEDNSSLRKVIR